MSRLDTYENVVVGGELRSGDRAGASEGRVSADAGCLAAGDEEQGRLEVIEAAIVQPAREEVHGGQKRDDARVRCVGRALQGSSMCSPDSTR